MKISWLSSKRCSRARLTFWGFALSLAGALPTFSYAAIPRSTPIQKQLRADLKLRNSGSFDAILNSWEKKYGNSEAAHAVIDALFDFSRDHSLNDEDRYIALMGMARLGGKSTAPRIASLLHDSSWMIRSGSLRALSAMPAESTGVASLPLSLLKDPALVVRMEAIACVERLRPPGATRALLAAASDPINYHAGKSLWVPERAILALERLTGHHLAVGKPLKQKITAWKTELGGATDASLRITHRH